jgi:hypothetical protein
MVCKGSAGNSSRGISDEPEIATLAALVREGKLSSERLTAEIERRQLSLFTMNTGGEHGTDGNK